MKRVVFVLFLSILLLVSSCVMKIPEKSDLPSWSVTIEVPLVKETITIDELLEDSLFVGIPYGTDGDSIFAYQDAIEIEKVEVGDQLNIDDIQQSFTQSIDDVKVDENSKQYSSQLDPVGVEPVNQSVNSSLGKIALDDTDPTETDPVLLTDLIDTTGVGEGDKITIPQSTDIPTIYRNVSFNDFDNADFSNGYLAITISNDLVIELGAPITVRLLESDSTIIYGSDGDSARAIWEIGIMPNNSTEKTISLAGKVLPGNIIIQITGVVAGSASKEITNDEPSRNSSFVVQVQAKNLEVISAQAIIPEQEIDTTDAITLVDSENKVQRAKILNGSLAVDIANNLPVDANLELTITSIDVSDVADIQPFTQTIPLKANQSSNPVYSLNDASLVMDVNDQKVEYSYHIITQDTDPDKVEISENDGVTVDISIYGSSPGEEITFSEFEGIVAQDPILESGEIDVTTDSKITAATISSGSMNITIRNNINLTDSNVPQLSIVIPEFIDQSSNPINITRDLLPEPNTTIIEIDLAGYVLHPNTIDVSADSFNQNITYTSDVVIPSGVISSYDLQGDISVEILVSELAFSSVTGYFNQDAIVDNNVIVLEEEATKIEEALFNTGELVLTIVNNIGAIAEVNFSIDEIVNKSTDAPLQHTINLSNSSDPVIESIPLGDYKIMIPLTDISANQEIHYTSTVGIPSDQEMTLNFGNEIDVNVDLVNLSFESVAGYIDTVSVSIDSVDQEITALPDELNGINLNDVEIQIEFDSNIDVPIVLDLTLVSSNESGETVESTVHQNITGNPIVQIPSASALINIKPNRIIAFGSASVGGSGYVSVDQYIQGTMNISIPMSFEITEDATIDIEPSLVKEEMPEELEEITLYALLDNQFEFNGILQVLAAKDTLYFDDDPLIEPDTIATFHLLPDSVYEEIIVIDDAKFNLFQDSLYINTVVKLLNNFDSV